MIKTVAKIIILPLAVLIVHATLIIFLNIYEFFPWFDIPMHFLGGLSIAISYFLILTQLQHKKYLGKTHSLVFFTFLISLVALTAVVWEFAEFVADISLKIHSQNGLQDTMGDLLFGLIGGTIGYIIMKITR